MDRYYYTSFTVAAGGAATQQWVTEAVHLVDLRIVIPDGHSGLTGLQILQHGTPVFPFGGVAYLTGNDDVVPVTCDYDLDTQGLTLIGYNTDFYPHTWWLTAHLTDLQTVPQIAASSPDIQAGGTGLGLPVPDTGGGDGLPPPDTGPPPPGTGPPPPPPPPPPQAVSPLKAAQAASVALGAARAALDQAAGQLQAKG